VPLSWRGGKSTRGFWLKARQRTVSVRQLGATFTPEQIEARLRARPFVPLRIVTSSNQAFDIYHPDLIMIGRRWLIPGTAGAEHPRHYEPRPRAWPSCTGSPWKSRPPPAGRTATRRLERWAEAWRSGSR